MRASHVATKLTSIAPALLAAAFVLNVFADSGEVLESLPRPLLIATAATAFVQFVASLVLRSSVRGALVAGLAVMAAIAPPYGFMFAAGGLVAAVYASRTGKVLPTEPAALLVLIIFVASMTRTLASPAFVLDDLSLPTRPAGTADRPYPDIYLVLMDGYPRSDTLAGYGYDNMWFESELEQRGFDVAASAHSNYSWTYLVLPTTFHMRHADMIGVLTPPPTERTAQRRAIRTALSATPATARLRQLGYRIVSAGLSGSSLQLRDVDEYADEAGVSLFEHQVLERTVLITIAESLILSGYRDRVLSGLNTLRGATEDQVSTFSFVHLLSPHVPFVFDRDGAMPQFSCDGRCSRFRIHADQSGLTREAFSRSYADQVDYLNGRILMAIDHVVAVSPDAVIILFSDHGSRSTQKVDAEWFSTFFAARTPGHAMLFGERARPIEIFPRLFRAYFGDVIAIPGDRSYISPFANQLPLTIEPWQPERTDEPTDE
ncbi:MAG: hypothetical protein WED86_03735 [Chloroflexota bacterium]